ncbi:hypothetical protein N665_0851s0013 [Sinapis alba]|nr:hypothetical protein N665_0851s0013 [Sinapis alba]
MNNEIEQETLSSGALGFMRKPIKPNDLNTISKNIDHKINDGSKKIQDNIDSSEKIQETNSSSDPCDEDSSSQATQKFKIKWKGGLENQFNKAIQHIGVHKATPKKILKFMNLDFLTKSHISSKLQKYRQTLKRVGEERMKKERMEKARIAMYPNFSSAAGYIYPQDSYNYNTRLGNNNLFNVQPGYGLGQSSSMMNNNASLHDSDNSMNRRPTYDLSQTGPKLFPRRGNLGFQNGISPLKEEWRSIPETSQAPRFGQYGNVLGMNCNPTTGSGSLQGMNVHGNGHGSLGGIRGHGPDNGSLEGIRVHGNNNDWLGGIRVNVIGTGSVGGIGVHGTGNNNGSLGENFGTNQNFSNNNMNNHGSSTSMFPYVLSSSLDNKDLSQNDLIAQTGGVIPALDNSKIFNDHHDINEFFSDTNNSQFHHQNQLQRNLSGVNLEAPTAYPLEDTSSWKYNDGNNNEEKLNSLAANPEMYFPTQDMNITNQGNNHEETLNSLAANPEMYFPTQDMNITNQDYDDGDYLNYLIDPDMN